MSKLKTVPEWCFKVILRLHIQPGEAIAKLKLMMNSRKTAPAIFQIFNGLNPAVMRDILLLALY